MPIIIIEIISTRDLKHKSIHKLAFLTSIIIFFASSEEFVDLNHSILKLLLPILSSPIVSTSIHDPDKILDYTTDPEILFEKWNSEIDLMLSDGYGKNIPSTVIDLTKTPYEIIRKGAGDIPKNLLINL